MLGHKTCLNKIVRLLSLSCVFSNYTSMKIEVNYLRNVGKFTNMWKLNNTLLNNWWVKKEIKSHKRNKIKIIKANENVNTTYPNFWGEAIAALRLNSNKCLY